MAAALIAFPQALPAPVDLNSALRPLNALLLIGLAIGGLPILWWYCRWSRQFSPSLYLTAVIGTSALVYYFIEELANRWLRTRLQAKSALET